MNIILYKSATCTQCKMIKSKLEKKGYTFTEEMDIDVMAERGIKGIPTLEVDGERMTEIGIINRWVNALEVKNG